MKIIKIEVFYLYYWITIIEKLIKLIIGLKIGIIILVVVIMIIIVKIFYNNWKYHYLKL